MTHVEVECCFCHTRFNTSLKNYNWANKQKWKFFCSKICRINNRKTSTKEHCATCNKEVEITPSQKKHSKSGNVFCSHTCSILYSNANRVHSEERKKEISEKTRNSIKKYLLSKNIEMLEDISCVVCGKKFKPSHKKTLCCSFKCGKIRQFGSLPYTKEEMINKIYEISNELKRTPQRRECENKLWHSAVNFFGSWNKAMESCGLKPNHSKYQKIRLKCNDGHMADSLSEKVVDDWLFFNNIKHERNKKYPNVNFNCDFFLVDYNMWIEYFGLIGQVEEYDKVVEIKRQIVKDNNLKFIEIIPSDLYPQNKLNAFLPMIKGGGIMKKEMPLFDDVAG